MQLSEIVKMNMPGAVRDMKPEQLNELSSAVRETIIETV